MITHERFTVDCDLFPNFTAAYLRIAGDECAFIETNTSHAVPKLLAALASRGRRVEDVRWIVVTHAHLDHAGGAGVLLAKCPNATLLAHPRAARHLVDPSKLVASAKSVYGEERFAELYGSIEAIPRERVRALDDGATFALGGATLRVIHTAGHAKHHFVVHDPAIESVYTGDSFGLVYPALQKRGRFAIASTSPTDFDPAEARKSLAAITALGAKAACLTHFDAITDIAEVGSQVGAWIDRSEALRDEAARTDDTLDAMTARLAEKLRAAIDAEQSKRGLAFGDAEWKQLELDIELNAQGISFVASKLRGTRPST
jgi:glyoxylase-like metal-dependent hydrolase (beta-lactamase superfamily II)